MFCVCVCEPYFGIPLTFCIFLQIVFVPVRANVNLKNMTIEEFSGLKKRMHISSFSLLIEEIRVALNKIINKEDVQAKWMLEDPGIRYTLDKLVEKIIQDCEAKRWEHELKAAEEYKQEYFFRERVNEMLDMKTMAMSKLKLWTKNDNERIPNIFNLQLREAHRKWVFFLQKQLDKAEGEKDKSEVKKIAIRICKCKGLFEKGVNDTNDIGEVTMLRAAAEGESALTLKLLKLAGADINTGQSQDDDCAKENCEGIHGDRSNDAESNQQRPIPLSAKTALMIAAENGHTNTVLVLHELNADMSATSEGFTALMLAAKNGHTETVLKLCELHADVHQLCLLESRKTSLMLAAENGHKDTVQALFNFGAKLWSYETDCSALCLAAENGHIETVQLLCRLSNIQAQTVKNGLADLLAMARKGSTSITDKLVSWETIEHLLLIGPASSFNFDHVVTQSEISKESTVNAIKDLFHNVQKNHDFSSELKKARALVVGKTQVPGGITADDEANPKEPREDEESKPKTQVINDVVLLSNEEKDGPAPLRATSTLEVKARESVYVQIKSHLDEQIEIWSARDLLKLGGGDSPSGVDAAGSSSGLEISLIQDVIGYGVVAAHGILEYRGLIS
jgi:ankyrin repeat protein